jgi:hypothetical protein
MDTKGKTIMSWNPAAINLLSTQYNGSAMVSIIQSLVKELARLQLEIDILKKEKR